MFSRLIDAGRMRDIHVAWDKDGKLVGATLAALYKEDEGSSPMHDALAWPVTLGALSSALFGSCHFSCLLLKLTLRRASLRRDRMCRRCLVDPRIRSWCRHGSFSYPESH